MCVILLLISRAFSNASILTKCRGVQEEEEREEKEEGEEERGVQRIQRKYRRGGSKRRGHLAFTGRIKFNLQ